MEWLISANHHKYDHERAFEELPYIDWKQNAKYEVGDRVYIYASKPSSCIEYLVEVIDTDISGKTARDDKKYWIDDEQYYSGLKKGLYSRFKLLRKYSKSLITLKNLHENGMKGNVQGPRRLYENGVLSEWGKYIHSVDSSIEDTEHLVSDKKLISEIDEIYELSNISETEKKALTKIRIGQSTYRNHLLTKHDNRCMICGLEYPELLIASHIKEWSESKGYEKIDSENGLLLCTLHDSVFDKHLVTFDDDGRIIISSKLSKRNRILLNLDEKMRINMSEKTKQYMKYHRKIFYEINIK